MTLPHRRVARLGVVAVVTALAGLLPAVAASAHPLGNFTVNQSSNLRIQTDHVLIDHVLDEAEIPTLQERQRIDTNGDGKVSDDEAGTWARATCAIRAAGLELAVDGRAEPLSVLTSAVSFPAGQAGLRTLRLVCALRSDHGIGDARATVTLRTTLDEGRVGWREMTAVGDGTTLVGSPLPTTSPSKRLTRYPADLLTNPLDVRSTAVTATPGGPRVATSSVDGPLVTLPRGIDGPTTWFESLVARPSLGVWLTIAALALSLLLGGIHALSPGHGKTVMAAYLVGQQGSWRTVSLIGLTVTLTHTAGVLLLGVLISASVTLAPERLYPLLGTTTGVIIVGFGLVLLRNRLRTRRAVAAAVAGHEVAHDHAHDEVGSAGVLEHGQHLGAAHAPPPHDHDHPHPHDHLHPHPHDHPHDHPAPVVVPAGGAVVHTHGGRTHSHVPVVSADGTVSRRGLLALGFADGLVPSPSALVVLLGAISLHRTWFGVLLVLGYGVGMALTLVAVGLLLGRLRDRMARRNTLGGRTRRWLAVLPVATSVIIIVVGLYLTARGVEQLATL